MAGGIRLFGERTVCKFSAYELGSLYHRVKETNVQSQISPIFLLPASPSCSMAGHQRSQARKKQVTGVEMGTNLWLLAVATHSACSAPNSGPPVHVFAHLVTRCTREGGYRLTCILKGSISLEMH